MSKTPVTVKKTIAVKPATNNKINKPVAVVKKPAAKVPVVSKSVPKKPVTSITKTNSAKQVSPVQAKIPNKPEVISLTSREQNMINEINKLRLNPPEYCAYVKQYLVKNDCDKEVQKAARELMDILKKMKPLAALQLNPLMYQDARQYGLLMKKNNEIEHSNLPYAENLSLGYSDVRDAIIDLLIDDGIPDRGHRRNLLNEKIKHVAVFEVPGKIQDLGNCYVQVFK